MPGYIEHQYHLSYPEIEALPKKNHYEKGYFNWKKSLRRFCTAARPAFKLSDAQVSTLHNELFLVADKGFLQEFTELLAVPKFVDVVNEFFKPAQNFNLLFTGKGGSKTLWEQVINAVEHYLIVNESEELLTLPDSYQPVIDRMFAEIRFLSILDRPQALDAAMSFIELPGMLSFIQRDYELHPGTKVNRLLSWSKTFPFPNSMREYALHPRRESVHTTLSYENLIKVYSGLFDRRTITPLFWLENPVLLKLVTKLVELYPDPKLLQAGDRRLIFQLLMSCLGRHGTTEEQILAEVFALWQPQLERYKAQPDTFENKKDSQLTPEDEFYFFYSQQSTSSPNETVDQKFAALQMLSVASQREWLGRIKNGDPVKYPEEEKGLSAPGLQRARKNIRKRNGIPEALSSTELLAEAERTNWLESRFHPLYPYMALGGFEIEANFPAEMTYRTSAPNLYRVIGQYGYRNGNDVPTELSPDPFVRPEVVIGQFSDYVNSGLLDLSAETNQSAHLNIEVLSREHFAYLFRLSYLTGIGNHPLFLNEMNTARETLPAHAFHQLSIHEKISEPTHNVKGDRKHYIEGKGYRVTTASDFQALLRMSMMLGSATRMYEQAWCNIYSTTPDEFRLKEKEAVPIRPNISLTSQELQTISDSTARELAFVWHHFMVEARQLTDNKSFKLYEFWRPTCKLSDVARLGGVVREILPTVHHHDDVVALQKRTSKHNPITYDGKTFPNILTAARHLSEKHIQLVRKAYRHKMDEFRKIITPLLDIAPGSEQQIRRDEVFVRLYGDKILTELSGEERQALLEKIRFHVFEDSLLKDYDYNIPK